MHIEIKEYEDYIRSCRIFIEFTGIPMYTEEEWFTQFEEYFFENHLITQEKKNEGRNT